MQNGLLLAVGKAHIEHATEGFDYHQGIELSPGVVVLKGTKMAPVDLHLLARGRFKAGIGDAVLTVAPDLEQIVADNGNLAVKAVFGQMLQHHRGTDRRVLIQQIFNQIPIRVDLGCSGGPFLSRRGIEDILFYRFPVDAKVPGDFSV